MFLEHLVHHVQHCLINPERHVRDYIRLSFLILEMAFGFSEGSAEMGRSLSRFGARQRDRSIPGWFRSERAKHFHQHRSYTLVRCY